MKLATMTLTGEKSTISAPAELFAVEVHPSLIAQAIRVYLSNQRQGTAKTKTRSEVARTKKKWFKQKGTGNARHGARTPSLFVGGGVSHGPTGEQNWQLKLPAHAKRQAFLGLLHQRLVDIVVVSDVSSLPPKTKSAAELLAKVAAEDERVLVVKTAAESQLERSARNITQVLLAEAKQLNIYELAVADKILLTEAGLAALQQRFATVKTKSEVKANVAEKIVKSEVIAKKTSRSTTVKTTEPKSKPVKSTSTSIAKLTKTTKKAQKTK